MSGHSVCVWAGVGKGFLAVVWLWLLGGAPWMDVDASLGGGEVKGAWVVSSTNTPGPADALRFQLTCAGNDF